MPDLKTILKKRLKGAKRLAVLGIGSELRGDDIAGLIVTEKLDKSLKGKNKTTRIKIFFGGTAPENLTGEIKRYKPTHLVIIDTAEIGQKPGTILFASSDDIGSGATFSTHTMPAKILAQYIIKSFKCEVMIIGIQPKTLGFGKKPTKAISDAAKEVAAAIIGCLG